MGISSIFKKIGEGVKKGVKKIEVEYAKRKEIKLLKEKYLSQLSKRELVQLYKIYAVKEEIW